MPVRRTRLAMMLPGAVSLGAYEGGALAAILVAVQSAQGDLLVDAISSASAGSITALVAAKALLTGADPVKLMTGAWVDLPSLRKLKTHDANSPLSMEKLHDAAEDLLGPTDVPAGTYRQREPMHFSMALTALGGLTYRMPRLRDVSSGHAEETPLGQTYVDWYSRTVSGPTPDLLEHIEGALASGSTPVGFPPRLMDREADTEAIRNYTRAGVIRPRDGWHLWYSDGGDIDNEPFGRVLDLIESIETSADDERVIVLLQTQPPSSVVGGKWFDPDPAHVPTWTSTLLHVGHIQKAQNYFEDLRRLEKTNSRLVWTERVANGLGEALDDALSRLQPAQRETMRELLSEAIDTLTKSISEDQAGLRNAVRGSEPAASDSESRTSNLDPSTTTANELLALFELASGLHGKREVMVEVISPDIDENDRRPAAEKLAGEFLFHFGGFLEERYRQSDFALGYRNARIWLERWLPGRVSDANAVLAAVNTRYTDLGWDQIDEGAAAVHLWPPNADDVQLAELVSHMIKVLTFGFWRDVHQRNA